MRDHVAGSGSQAPTSLSPLPTWGPAPTDLSSAQGPGGLLVILGSLSPQAAQALMVGG